MAQAAISGDYVDLKFIKGRKVAQIVIEIPIETANAFVQAFGTPSPAEGVPVALARLQAGKAEPEAAKAPRRMNELPLVSQAVLLCKREAFWRYLNEHGWICSDEAAATDILRQICTIASRADLKSGTDAAARFWKLQGDFDVWMRVAA